jgi:hypothetical protein
MSDTLKGERKLRKPWQTPPDMFSIINMKKSNKKDEKKSNDKEKEVKPKPKKNEKKGKPGSDLIFCYWE